MITAHRNQLGWLCRRAVWIAGLLSHSHWFARGLGAGENSAASLVLFALALVFFALKTVDVPFLRIRWTHRSLPAAPVIVLFLHANAIGDALPDHAGLSIEWVSAEASTVFLLRKALLRAVFVIAATGLMGLAHREKIVRPDRGQSASRTLATRLYTSLMCDSPLRAPPI